MYRQLLSAKCQQLSLKIPARCNALLHLEKMVYACVVSAGREPLLEDLANMRIEGFHAADPMG
jgi:hypothetical protein